MSVQDQSPSNDAILFKFVCSVIALPNMYFTAVCIRSRQKSCDFCDMWLDELKSLCSEAITLPESDETTELMIRSVRSIRPFFEQIDTQLESPGDYQKNEQIYYTLSKVCGQIAGSFSRLNFRPVSVSIAIPSGKVMESMLARILVKDEKHFINRYIYYEANNVWKHFVDFKDATLASHIKGTNEILTLAKSALKSSYKEEFDIENVRKFWDLMNRIAVSVSRAISSKPKVGSKKVINDELLCSCNIQTHQIRIGNRKINSLLSGDETALIVLCAINREDGVAGVRLDETCRLSEGKGNLYGSIYRMLRNKYRKLEEGDLRRTLLEKLLNVLKQKNGRIEFTGKVFTGAPKTSTSDKLDLLPSKLRKVDDTTSV